MDKLTILLEDFVNLFRLEGHKVNFAKKGFGKRIKLVAQAIFQTLGYTFAGPSLTNVYDIQNRKGELDRTFLQSPLETNDEREDTYAQIAALKRDFSVEKVKAQHLIFMGGDAKKAYIASIDRQLRDLEEKERQLYPFNKQE